MMSFGGAGVNQVTSMPIITSEQILKLRPNYNDDFPSNDHNLVECPDRLATVFNGMGYFCVSSYNEDAHTHYVFQRDPWESEIVIRHKP
jgi:hypothetical protein